MKLLITFLLSAGCAWGVEPLEVYNPANCVPYQDAPTEGYCRVDYQWFIRNTGQPSLCYQNGLIVPSLTETGMWDAGIADAWAIQPYADGVIVGVIDTGCDPANTDMQGVVIAGRRIEERNGIDRDELSNYNFHGPKLCEIIAADDNGIGIRGVASGAKLVVVRCLFETSEIVKGMNWCMDQGAKIICLSWGEIQTEDTALLAAMQRANQLGVIVVSALGYAANYDVLPTFPYSWSFPLYVPVFALKRDGTQLVNQTASRAIGAPGRIIVTSQGYSSGNSFASPIVAGVLALMIAHKPKQSPWSHPWQDSFAQVIKLKASTDSLKRLNVLAALQAL